MQTVQRLLLLLFAAFAALTVLQQIRYGMICGRSEQEDKQDAVSYTHLTLPTILLV